MPKSLDKWIAENIMGLEIDEYFPYGGPTITEERSGVHPRYVPRYSTDISCAMTIVEKLKPHLRLEVIPVYDPNTCGHGYLVQFLRFNPDDEWIGWSTAMTKAIETEDLAKGIAMAAMEAFQNLK